MVLSYFVRIHCCKINQFIVITQQLLVLLFKLSEWKVIYSCLKHDLWYGKDVMKIRALNSRSKWMNLYKNNEYCQEEENIADLYVNYDVQSTTHRNNGNSVIFMNSTYVSYMAIHFTFVINKSSLDRLGYIRIYINKYTSLSMLTHLYQKVLNNVINPSTV